MNGNLTINERREILATLALGEDLQGVKEPYTQSLGGCEVTYFPGDDFVTVKSKGAELEYHGSEEGPIFVIREQRASKIINGVRPSLEKIVVRRGRELSRRDHRQYDVLLQTVKAALGTTYTEQPANAVSMGTTVSMDNAAMINEINSMANGTQKSYSREEKDANYREVLDIIASL